MNASSGIYNVNAYNILCTNTTILSSLSVGGVDIGGYINSSTTNFSNINLTINNLNTTTITIFNSLNSFSNNSQLSINNLNTTSTTIFNNLNNLSTNSTLSINNLNTTSTALLGLINGHTTSIGYLNATSTTIFNNLNNLSTNSTLAINNLNATSTTIFNNLNNLSTNSTLAINNLNATSTTIFNNLNSFSTNSQLSINNLNLTTTSIISSLNNISTNSQISNLTSNIILPPPSNLPSVISGGTNGALTNLSPNVYYFVFTSTGTNSITFSSNTVCEVFIVGGGGGGGGGFCGGGGGGGNIYYNNAYTFNSGTYNINIGVGGSGGLSYNASYPGTAGSTGGTTSITLSSSTILSAPGGSGGGSSFNGYGGNSGSVIVTNGSSVSTSYAGHASYNDGSGNYSGGGGAGSSQNGGVGATLCYGGDGYQSSITGTPIYYAGGGSGKSYFIGFGDGLGFNGYGAGGGGGQPNNVSGNAGLNGCVVFKFTVSNILNMGIVNNMYVSGTTTFHNATTHMSSLNVSGTTTLNSPLNISTNQSTTTSALNINSTTMSVLVNIIQNAVWNDGVNYALNVSGYSMLGGVQINGQDTNNIYKRVGDLTLASPSTNNIIFKTNFGNWEALRINTSGTSMNTSLYISGTTILNNSATCLSSLYISGTTILKSASTCLSTFNVDNVIELTQYLKLSGTNAPSVSFPSYGNNNIGVASASGNFSSSAGVGDMIIRTPNKLHLQNGVGAAGLTVHTNNYIGIGTTTPSCKLDVYGAVNIRGASAYAVPNSKNYGAGCLTIGDITVDYGGSTGTSWGTNMGLLMECYDNTEISVHDANTRLSSLLYYVGSLNRIIMGRDMGWGVTDVSIAGGLIFQDGWQIKIGTIAGIAWSFGIGHVKTGYYSVWYLRGDEPSTTYNLSDNRIKKDIDNIYNSIDLINSLQPKKYKRLDNQDEISEYGLIAQEVEKVIPEIVFNEPNYIPDIYDYCSYDNKTKIIITKKDISNILKEETRIKIIRDNGDGIKSEKCMCINGNHNNKYIINDTTVIKIIDNYTFQINDNIDIEETELFIYGSLKEDFKTINYQSLHAISIQSIKELYKLIQQQNQIIQDLQSRLSILENK